MRCYFTLMIFLFSHLGWAHKPSDSYLNIKANENMLEGRWDIALRDLDFAIGLDLDNDGNITWGEVKSRKNVINSYAFSHLRINSSNTNCDIAPKEFLIDHHSDGSYVVLGFNIECPEKSKSLTLNYSLFFDLDPQHKGLLNLNYDQNNQAAIFSLGNRKQTFDLITPSTWHQFVDYCKEGVWHIWIGFDHILFLISLLLPAVFIRHSKRWQPVNRFYPSFIEVFKIVTAFTLAHSFTLTLATLNILVIPSRVVESVIALSVVLAALNNIFVICERYRWVIAFVFGLIHGFGFASVLNDLGLSQNTLVLALVSFNIGVEFGQLVIVSLFLPLAYLLRRTMFYRQIILFSGSILIIILASLWFIERAFNLEFLPI